MDFPLKPENEGSDLPNKVKFLQGIKSRTFLFHDKPKSARRPSKIPQRSHHFQSALSNRPSNSLIAPSKKTIYADDDSNSDNSLSDDFVSDNENDNENDTENSKEKEQNTKISNNVISDDDDDEEDLTLVYIKALDCYYCPADQKYYQIIE